MSFAIIMNMHDKKSGLREHSSQVKKTKIQVGISKF
jgi:hypothetical protein